MNSLVITGGHHSSAIEVIKELRKRHPNLIIYWYGHKHSLQGSKNETLEFKEITDMDIPFYSLQAGKFYKTFNPIRLAKIPYGFFQSLFLLAKHKPDLILSFGGYLAVPVVLAGWLLGIPSVSHEQTVSIGYANRLIGKFAKEVFYTWDESAKFIPKTKAVKTGLPLRKEVTKPAHKKFQVENSLPTIYVTAGKTGSHVINEAILENQKHILELANIIHQTGDHSGYKDYEKIKDSYENIKSEVLGKHFIQKFVYSNDIGDAYNEASLVISRSGAHTILELMKLKKPCILIPIPWSSHNEQYKNAKIVEDSGLGVIYEQGNLKDKKLFIRTIRTMLSNLNSYKCSYNLTQTDLAAQNIVDEIEKIAKKKN